MKEDLYLHEDTHNI